MFNSASKNFILHDQRDNSMCEHVFFDRFSVYVVDQLGREDNLMHFDPVGTDSLLLALVGHNAANVTSGSTFRQIPRVHYNHGLSVHLYHNLHFKHTFPHARIIRSDAGHDKSALFKLLAQIFDASNMGRRRGQFKRAKTKKAHQ